MRQLNTAVVGLGAMGKLYARILAQLPSARLAAVCGNRATPLQDFAAEMDVPAYPNGDVAGMLAAHPDLEALLICTPEDAHLDSIQLAARAGKHLLIEKPLAANLAEARQIAASVREAGVLNMMAHSLRFDPRYAGARDAASRGEIGEVVHMYARRNTPLPLLRRIGGRVSGTFWVGVHDLDFMLWLKGCRITHVFSRQAGSAVAEVSVDHAITSSLRFEDGSVGVLENVWGSAVYPGRHARLEFQINGSQGTIEIQPTETGLGVFKEGTVIYPDTVYAPVLHGRLGGVYRDQVEHFVEAVLAGRPPVVTVEAGLATVAVAEAIETSRAEGREVAVQWPD